ncbi:MAG: hypothetical protein ACRYFS_25590 [Janthinobacterium lividum]
MKNYGQTIKNHGPPTALTCLLALTPLLLALHPAAAQTTAVSAPATLTTGSTGFETSVSYDSSTGTYDENASANLGFSFTVNAPIVITGLGFFADPSYYDANNPSYDTLGSTTQPYASSHAVGIYAADGSVLISGTVSQSDTLTNYFRYSAPSVGAGTVLLPGQTYIIAGVTGADDPYWYNVLNPDGSPVLTYASEINFGESEFIGGDSLASSIFSASHDYDPGFFGPNFQFSDAPVPEASTTVSLGLLLALGIGGLGLSVRRRSPCSH